jgi:ABC-2 type transport system permease protein
MLLVYTLVFEYFLRVGMENFSAYFMIGYLPWNFFVIALLTSCSSIVDAAGLIKKVWFPRMIIPLAIVLSSFVQFLLTLVVLFPALFYFRISIGPSALLLPAVMLLHILFTAGLSFLFATLYVSFRDTRHFLEILATIWFWMTPIVYGLERVPAEPRALRALLLYNPMTQFVNAYRDILFLCSFPSPRRWLAIGAVTLVALSAGLFVFHRRQPKFAEML